MRKPYALLILIVPALATLAILVWSGGIPIFYLLSDASVNLHERWEHIAFIHVCIYMFEAPAYAWISPAIAGFVLGATLLLCTQSRSWRGPRIALGIALAGMPVVVVALAPFFAEYRGP